MGYIGQLPQSPDALPGHETSTGEPPEAGRPRADQLPSLTSAGSLSLNLTPAPAADEAGDGDGAEE